MKKAVIFLFIFLSCFLSKAQKFDSAFHYRTKNFDAAIFPKEYKRYEENWDSSRIKFTPDTNEICIAYKALRDSY
ncbi:MAG TPA: hypothetical protein VK808_04275 [Bacteroidia bacterium]|jgi:hypothetical protein|nr:hypothetical protein [Bacteroidia bacterium]